MTALLVIVVVLILICIFPVLGMNSASTRRYREEQRIKQQRVPQQVQQDKLTKFRTEVTAANERKWQEGAAKLTTTEAATRYGLERGWIRAEMLSEAEKKKFLNPDGSIKRQEEK